MSFYCTAVNRPSQIFSYWHSLAQKVCLKGSGIQSNTSPLSCNNACLDNLLSVSNTGSKWWKVDKLNFGCENIYSSLSAAPSAELDSAPEGLRFCERGHRFPGTQGNFTCLGSVNLHFCALSLTYWGGVGGGWVVLVWCFLLLLENRSPLSSSRYLMGLWRVEFFALVWGFWGGGWLWFCFF